MKRWGIKTAAVILLILIAGAFIITEASALDPELVPPVAGFTTSLENIILYENVTFDGSSSYDPNGMNLTYSWDFDQSNDIQEDATGKVTEHLFKMVGTYVVTLTISNGNTKAIARKDLVVYAGSEKVFPPVAVISTKPALNGTVLFIEPNTAVEFNGKGSFDPNADPLEHEWHFSDGSGNSSADTFDHLFGESGTYYVTLTVTTKDGKTDSTTLSVLVRGEPPDTGEGDQTESESGMGWALFIIMIFILLLLGLGGFIVFMVINQKRNAMKEGDPEDAGGRGGRFRTMAEKKAEKQKKRVRGGGGITELRRKERRLGKQIKKEEEELDKEMKSSAFSGLMDMFTAKPKEGEEEVDPHGTKRRAQARPRREKDEEKKSATGVSVRYPKGHEPKEAPAKRPPRGGTPPKRGAKPGGVSLRPKRGKDNDEQIKKELEKETSKLESFLSDILSSPKKDDADGKTLPRGRQPRSLPPAREQKMRAPPRVPSTPSKPTKARSDKDMSDADIKAELKKMEEEMDKDISKLFGK